VPIQLGCGAQPEPSDSASSARMTYGRDVVEFRFNV
jgi:hypothetical protein